MLNLAASLTASKTLLRSTGAGLLLGNALVWAGLTQPWQAKRLRTVAFWKRQCRSSEGSAEQGPVAQPLGALKAPDFLAAVRDMERQMKTWCSNSLMADLASDLSLRVVLLGFVDWRHLEGVRPEVARLWAHTPQEEAALFSFVTKVNEVVYSARFAVMQTEMCSRFAFRRNDNMIPVNASEFASKLSQGQMVDIEAKTEGMFRELDVDFKDAGPSNVSRALASAVDQGKGAEVDKVLELRALGLMMSSQRRSMASVASGLRCWRYFASSVLGYHGEAMLPPTAPEHIIKFACIFRNSGTARNYIGYIKWACVASSLGIEWWDPSVQLLLKGLQKQQVAHSITSTREWRMSQLLYEKLVHLADAMEMREWGDMAVLSWNFLLRVQSEAVPLEKGSPIELVQLFPERRSAVFIEGSWIHLRLQRRKNRHFGSLLKRRCVCDQEDPRLCPVHRLSQRLCLCGAGQRLFSLTPSTAFNTLRRLLGLLSEPAATFAGLKVFRAGRATAMALLGWPLLKILQEGEWKSAALLHYASEDSLDAGAVLRTVLEESDVES
ncbi:unnamed protein product [Polarella glacialis]|uniref:Uncharacterized protein n=1 Tax=Polarella glacialis TaxID=89957 RepID=A0A813HPP7_POLGL|nr:unnamed protein product [Polarella glacialis]